MVVCLVFVVVDRTEKKVQVVECMYSILWGGSKERAEMWIVLVARVRKKNWCGRYYDDGDDGRSSSLTKKWNKK